MDTNGPEPAISQVPTIFDKLDEYPDPAQLTAIRDVFGQKWLPGRLGVHTGPQKADVMIVGQCPSEDDLGRHRVFSGTLGTILSDCMQRGGLDMNKMYLTNAVKYMPPGGKRPAAGDVKNCLKVLMNEILEVQPKLIVCLGATAVEAVMGRGCNLTDNRGAVSYPDRLGGDIQVYCTWHPNYIRMNPGKSYEYVQNWTQVEEVIKGKLQRKWKAKNSNNHWLDAAYMSDVAASMLGVRLLKQENPAAAGEAKATAAGGWMAAQQKKGRRR